MYVIILDYLHHEGVPSWCDSAIIYAPKVQTKLLESKVHIRRSAGGNRGKCVQIAFFDRKEARGLLIHEQFDVSGRSVAVLFDHDLGDIGAV